MAKPTPTPAEAYATTTARAFITAVAILREEADTSLEGVNWPQVAWEIAKLAVAATTKEDETTGG